MGIRIPDLLEGILEATAAEAAAKARITLLRAELEAEGRRRLAAEGAAPSWNAPQLGKVRLDPPSEWAATVADPSAFGSYIAQHHPSEATAVVRIPAADLDDALTALGFVGIAHEEARVEVRPAFRETYLPGLIVDVEEQADEDGAVDRTITVVDPATGQLVDGLSAQRSAAKLVVSLDRNRRAAAVDAAKAEAAALLADAATEDGPALDPDVIRARTVELEGLHADELTALAKRLELGSSGTKAALAERIARAELSRPARGRELNIGEALAKHAMSGGGFTTPEEELRRARADLGREPTLEDLERAGIVRPASELTAPERAIVDRFEAAPDALAEKRAPAEEAPSDDVSAGQPEKRAGHRIPYVGEGADGARRSAEIDRSEVDSLPTGPHQPGYSEATEERKAALLASVERWEQQAAELEQAAAALDAAGSREVLRRVARAKGINPGGTKPDLIDRLIEAGITAADVEVLA